MGANPPQIVAHTWELWHTQKDQYLHGTEIKSRVEKAELPITCSLTGLINDHDAHGKKQLADCCYPISCPC